MVFNSFLKSLILKFLFFAIVIIFLNLLIDPYGIFSFPRIKYLNEIKPAAATKVRTSKLHQVNNFNAKTIIVGNSRPELGLDPESKCWPSDITPIYNLAIPGLSFYYQIRYLQHALANNSPETILIGLDFLDFLIPESKNDLIWPPEKSFYDDKLIVDVNNNPNPFYLIQFIKEKFLALFTLSSTVDSINTLASQHNNAATSRTIAGFNPAEGYFKNIIKNEGQNILFKQKNEEVRKRLTKIKYKIFTKNHTSEEFKSLKMIQQYGIKNNINLIFFINPYHSDYLNLIYTSGYGALFEKWKLEISKIILSKPRIRLFDFSQYNSYTNEQFSEDKKTLIWFWEPAHYKKELGDVMIGEIFNTPCKKNVALGLQIE